jgi:quercetin dioxygenase-like cupin family protein
MLKQKRLNIVACVALAALAASAGGIAKDAEPDATQGPQAKRTIIERHDQAGVPGKEIVLGTAEFPRGAVIGWHTHSGDEAGYVLRGTLVLKTRGQPDRTLKAGDAFFNPRGAVHSLMAAPDADGGAVFSTWVVDKGKPLADPVP